MPGAERTPRVTPERRRFLIAAGMGLAVFALVAVLMRSGALDGVDERVVNLLAGRRRPPLIDGARTLDRLDTWWLLSILVAAVVGGLWWSGRMAQAVYTALTIGAALLLNPLLKLVFSREPPGSSDVTPAVYAFPSGHTTTTTAAVTALAVVAWRTRWRWPATAAAGVAALLMALSRVYLGVHWPSDVIAGLALGSAVAMAVRAVTPWPQPQEAAEEIEGRADDRGDRGIDVVFLDWGNTLMVDPGLREGPMKDWETVEAEAGAAEALARLAARYRLVVATNADDSPAPDVRLALARVGLDEHIEDVVSSADVGDRKPNYAFYRTALLREGSGGVPLDPRRAVMVGDGTSNDIGGAQRAGMRTIWYNPTKRAFPEGKRPPDAVIRRLKELPGAVDRLAGDKARLRRRGRRREEEAAAEAAAAAVRDLRAAAAAEDSAASAAAAFPGGADEAAAAVTVDRGPALPDQMRG